MAEALYHYGPTDNSAGYNLTQLTGEITAAGLPAHNVHGSGYPYLGATVCPEVQVGFDPGLTPGQMATLDGIIVAHNPAGPRRPRLLYNIWLEVNALTGVQKTNIGSDLFGGNPPKVSQDTGPHAPSLLILWTMRQLATLSLADKRLMDTDAISIYTQDNPTYLVHPSFDPSILVYGDEPVP